MAAVDFLAGHAETMPDKPAVVLGARSLTFAELDQRANRVANAFHGLGVKAGDRVAVMSYNSIETFVLASGLRRAGIVIVPINYRLRGPEVAYVINDSGSRAVMAGPDHVGAVEASLPEVNGKPSLIAVGDQVPAGWLAYKEVVDGAADDPAPAAGTGIGPSMIYTSGTTGHPKGAWRPNGVNLENVLQIISIFGLNQSDVHLVCGPGYHSAVSFFTVLHSILGATVVLQPKFEAQAALDLIEHHRVTTTFMAPTLLQRLVDEQDRRARDRSSLRALILGAAPCPYALKVRAVAALGEVIWEFYGATETGINTVLGPQDQLRKPGSCGTAVPGQEIRLVDADGDEVPSGEPGELMVRNTWLAEYYQRPDATGRSLHDGFFSVGDIAYRDEEGYYFICDRSIDMIISGGVNVYPAEIEAVLHEHPAVQDAAVIGVPDEAWGEAVKAVVQLRDGATATEGELIAFCASRIAGYKKPRSVDFVAELPRDAAGKLLKRKLRDRFWAGLSRKI